MSSSKRIIKNTLFLYIRMFLIMGVTLYTSRIVLDVLGVSDYGVYNLVGGIVAMFGFFNAAMSSATQRYLSYDIGKNDLIKLKKTFSTTLTIHMLIAVLIVILTETIGLWYINYKMVYPIERTFAVNVVYQFSVFTFLLNIIQVPYNALIIARERMSVYSYVSVLEVLLKLGAVFLLLYFGGDKLIIYSILTFVTAFIIRMIYQIYCRRNFEESKFSFQYDKVYFKELLLYSGWNLFGNIATVARGQGNNMILNLFFGTIVNAAYGITMQVQSAVQMFVYNFQMALNPQIIQSYAAGDKGKSIQLMSQGSKFSFFLLLIVSLPILLNTEYILNLWLIQVPDHTIVFVQLSLIAILIDTISGPLMIMAQANGDIKWYQIVIGTLIFLNLPISYVLLYYTYNPSIVFNVIIFINIISFVFRLFFLKINVGLDVGLYLKKTIIPIMIVSSVFFAICFLFKIYTFKIESFKLLVVKVLSEVFVSLILIYILGINKTEKEKIRLFVLNKINYLK